MTIAHDSRLVLQFVTPESVIISVLVDTVMYSVLFVLALGEFSAC